MHKELNNFIIAELFPNNFSHFYGYFIFFVINRAEWKLTIFVCFVSLKVAFLSSLIKFIILLLCSSFRSLSVAFIEWIIKLWNWIFSKKLFSTIFSTVKKSIRLENKTGLTLTTTRFIICSRFSVLTRPEFHFIVECLAFHLKISFQNYSSHLLNYLNTKAYFIILSSSVSTFIHSLLHDIHYITIASERGMKKKRTKM